MTPAEVIAAAMDDTYEDEYGYPHAGTFAECAEAALVALRAAGYVVVELPEGEPVADGTATGWRLDPDCGDFIAAAKPGRRIIALGMTMTADEARVTAASLLAAAAAAEAGVV